MGAFSPSGGEGVSALRPEFLGELPGGAAVLLEGRGQLGHQPTRNRGRSPLGGVSGNAGQLEQLVLFFLCGGDSTELACELFDPLSRRHDHET